MKHIGQVAREDQERINKFSRLRLDKMFWVLCFLRRNRIEGTEADLSPPNRMVIAVSFAL